MISSLRFQGRMNTTSGCVSRDRVGRADRDVRARQEVALLVRVEVARVVDEVAADAAVVEQRVALRRSAVRRRSGCPRALRAIRNSSRSALRPAATSLGEAEVGLEARRSRRRARARAARARASVDRLRRVVGMAAVDAQRAAVRRQLLDVEQAQPVRARRPARRSGTRSRRSARGRSCRTGSRSISRSRCGNSIVITPPRLEQDLHARRRSR